jgi:hypothetical protein
MNSKIFHSLSRRRVETCSSSASGEIDRMCGTHRARCRGEGGRGPGGFGGLGGVCVAILRALWHTRGFSLALGR